MSGGSNQARRDALNSITNVDRLIKLIVEHGHNFNRHDVAGVYRKLAELLKKHPGSPQGLNLALENLKAQLLLTVDGFDHGNMSQAMRALGELAGGGCAEAVDRGVMAGLLGRLRTLPLEAFHPPHLVAILWVLAKHRSLFKPREESHILQGLCSAVLVHLPGMAPGQVGSLVWSLGLLRVDHPGLKEAIQTEILSKLPSYNVFNTTQTLSSLARMPGPASQDLLRALQLHLLAHHERTPETLTPRIVGGVLWGLASMAADPEPELVPRLTKLVVEHKGPMLPFTASSIMWSLAKWGQEQHAAPGLLDVLRAPLEEAPDTHLTSQSVANMVWACARGFIPQEDKLLAVLQAKALARAETFNSIETTQCLYAIVFADWEAPALTAALFQRCKADVGEFEAGVAASALIATSMRQYRRPGSADLAIIDPLLQRVEAKLEDVGIREAQAILFAMAYLGAPSDALYASVVARLPALAPDATKEVVCSLLWSLAFRPSPSGGAEALAALIPLLAQAGATLSESERSACAWALQVLGGEGVASPDAKLALTQHGLLGGAAGAAGEDAKSQGVAFVDVGSAFPLRGERGWRV